MFKLKVLLLCLAVTVNAQMIHREVDWGRTVSKESSRWFYERALAYSMRERTGKATAELYKALDRDPQNAEAHLFLGLLFSQRGMWKEAAESLEKAGTSHPMAVTELSVCYIRLNEYRKAINRLESLLKVTTTEQALKDGLDVIKLDLIKYENGKGTQEQIRAELLKYTESLGSSLESRPIESLRMLKSRGVLEPLYLIAVASEIGEEEWDAELEGLLQEVLEERGGFGPVLLVLLGRLHMQKGEEREALKKLELAVAQLEYLGLSEKNGDFTTLEIRQLREKLQSAR